MSSPSPAGWILRMLILTAVYFATGWAAHTISSPSGYVVAIWPPAGIALAAVLIWGWRITPGIALGHMLVTLTLFPVDLPKHLEVLMAAALSLGPVSQALFGAWLLRRWTQFPKPFENAQGVMGFLLLAGPVGCLLSATYCVSALTVMGYVGSATYASTWFTWWAGDSIGALVMCPLARPFLPEVRGTHRLRAILLPSSASLVVFMLLFVGVRATEGERLEAEFERRATNLSATLKTNTDHTVWAVRTLKGFFAGSEDVSREEFETFTRELIPTTPGLQALEWAPAVAHAQRAEIEARARAEGLDAFAFTEPRDGTMVPASERPLYFLCSTSSPSRPTAPPWASTSARTPSGSAPCSRRATAASPWPGDRSGSSRTRPRASPSASTCPSTPPATRRRPSRSAASSCADSRWPCSASTTWPATSPPPSPACTSRSWTSRTPPSTPGSTPPACALTRKTSAAPSSSSGRSPRAATASSGAPTSTSPGATGSCASRRCATCSCLSAAGTPGAC